MKSKASKDKKVEIYQKKMKKLWKKRKRYVLLFFVQKTGY
jgi:hypothetical protein